jgi:hypothetical protein
MQLEREKESLDYTTIFYARNLNAVAGTVSFDWSAIAASSFGR